MRLYVLTVLLMIFSLMPRAAERPDEIQWRYAEFVNAFSDEDWDQLAKSETESTKCGFGPGQEGTGCLRRMLEFHPSCKSSIMSALSQGCAIQEGGTECVSPPQAMDASVLYVGPRVNLSFPGSEQGVVIKSIICAGD